MIDAATRARAARMLLARRKARTSLLAFIQHVWPWFKVSWHHKLVCELLERVDGTASSTTISIVVGNTSPALVTDVDGVEHRRANPDYRETAISITVPKHIKRLMVFAPPRHSKSQIVSVARPAWSIGKVRTRMYMNIAYGSDLALTFSKGIIGLIKTNAYQQLFQVAFDRLASERWKVKRVEAEDNQKDSMIASGILSPLTGEGATDVNVDDPFKNKSEAYSKTIRDKVADELQTSVRTRLQRGATMCLMLTRWHTDDVAGRLIAQAVANRKADQWIVLVLAATNDDGERSYVWNTATNERTYLPRYDALWPGLFNRDELETTRASMASAFWEAMYMQAPTTQVGSIFKSDKWREYRKPIYCERVVHCWDTAMEDTDTADYSAFQSMGIADGRFIVRDAYRERLGFPDLIRQMYAKWQEDLDRGAYPERMLIEQKGSGISALQTIEANNLDPFFRGPQIPVLGMPATLSKEVRALSVSGYQEAGLIALPVEVTMDAEGHMVEARTAYFTTVDGTEMEWVADYLEEHTAFPKGRNDDWVDTTVHLLTYYTRPHGEEEHSETIIYDEDVTLSSELDRIDTGAF